MKGSWKQTGPFNGTGGTVDFTVSQGSGGNAGVGTDVAAAVAFYAPAMLSAPDAPLSPSVIQVMGEGATIETLRAATPITHVSREFPPTLLFHGNKDALVPHASSIRMYEALDGAGAPVELHMYNGAPHAFDAVPEMGRQCAAIMALFLDRHIVSPRPVAAPQAVS